MLKLILLITGGALADQCLVCSSTLTTLDETADALEDDNTPANQKMGKNCFNPAPSSGGEFPEKLKYMVHTCPGGCYSLAYEIIKKNKNPNVSGSKTVEFYIERGCQVDLPYKLQPVQNTGQWQQLTLNEENWGIKGTVLAKMTGQTAVDAESSTLKKLNWPENMAVAESKQLTCFKENKLIESNKLLDFKQPEAKVTCEFGENRCFSRVAHVELEGEQFVQLAIRGCASQNATLGINDAYYVESTLPDPYNLYNVTNTIEFCSTDNCNNKVQKHTTSGATAFSSMVFVTFLFAHILL